jgi:hypothetical protein
VIPLPTEKRRLNVESLPTDSDPRTIPLDSSEIEDPQASAPAIESCFPTATEHVTLTLSPKVVAFEMLGMEAVCEHRLSAIDTFPPVRTTPDTLRVETAVEGPLIIPLIPTIRFLPIYASIPLQIDPHVDKDEPVVTCSVTDISDRQRANPTASTDPQMRADPRLLTSPLVYNHSRTDSIPSIPLPYMLIVEPPRT